MTMTLVSSIQVGAGGAASIEFTGIPQTGTDLLLLFSGRSDAPGDRTVWVRINGLTSGYTNRHLYGTGSAVESWSPTGEAWQFFNTMPAASFTANTFNNVSVYLPNYTSSVAKTASADVVEENNATAAGALIFAGAQSTTSAITSLRILSSNDNLVQYSTASLYTITKGSGGASVS